MLFTNREALLAVPDPTLRRHALAILTAAVTAIDPERSVQRALQLDRTDDATHLTIGSTTHHLDLELELELDAYARIVVVGGGKAAAGMARGLYRALEGVDIDIDIDITGHLAAPEEGAVGAISLYRAGHPLPDDDSVQAATHILDAAAGATADDLVVALISGGGSAMLAAPLATEGVTLDDVRMVTDRLLGSGATIDELNIVRKHLSAIKGGRLARVAQPAQVVALVISDVVGDPLESIASGPTVPDRSTCEDALSICEDHGLIGELRFSLTGLLQRAPASAEPVRPEAPWLERVSNHIIASNRHALDAAAAHAEALGYQTSILTSTLTGEARHVAGVIAAIVNEVSVYDRPLAKPAALLFGGETTVTVTGDGRGGRNQELALAALDNIPRESLLAAMGTDGIDGRSPAAGAIADRHTRRHADERGLDRAHYLSDNDSYRFFDAVAGAMLTGPTGTNVADIIIALVGTVDGQE